MWYDLNFNNLIRQYFWKDILKPTFYACLKATIAPIATLHFTWSQFRNDNIYKLEHNGQVCYMRKALNDKYDPEERRIYIGDGQLFETLYIYSEGEAQDRFTHKESEESVIYLRTESETADSGFDFIVYVPEEIANAQIHGLNSLIKFYKLGGKRYSIYKI